MRNSIVCLAAVALCACGSGGDSGGSPAANAASNAASAAKPKSAYCFFKDGETKGWSASRDAAGNVVVKGKAYRQDSRYQAVLGEPQVDSNAARIAPSITQNNGGYAAPDNWWDVSATLPDSAAVATVTVECGKLVLAELKVPPAAR